MIPVIFFGLVGNFAIGMYARWVIHRHIEKLYPPKPPIQWWMFAYPHPEDAPHLTGIKPEDVTWR